MHAHPLQIALIMYIVISMFRICAGLVCYIGSVNIGWDIMMPVIDM